MTEQKIADLLKLIDQGCCTRELFDTYEDQVREYMTETGLSFGHFGLTENGFMEKRKLACKTSALHWLRRLRSGVVHRYNDYITYLRTELHEGHLSLADIGSSEEELEQLRVLGCTVTAQWYLKRMRSAWSENGVVSPSDLMSFDEEVREGRLSYFDLSVTTGELKKFKRASRTVGSMSLEVGQANVA